MPSRRREAHLHEYRSRPKLFSRERQRHARPDRRSARGRRRAPEDPQAAVACAIASRSGASSATSRPPSPAGSLLSLAAVPDLRPGPAPGRQRLRGRRAQELRLHADLAEHDPRARLRRAHEGLEGARRQQDRPAEPLRHDHAHARRRREVRAPLDPARHAWSTSPATAATRSTPPTPIGGPALAIKTVKQYLGIEINHLVEVNFANFPSLHRRAGRHQLHGRLRGQPDQRRLQERRLHAAAAPRRRNHLNGKQALALARTRKNECNTRENDLSRARRQQKILSRDQEPLSARRRSSASRGSRGRRRRRSAPTWPARRCSASSARSRPAARPPTRVLPGVPEGNGLTVPDGVKQREVQTLPQGMIAERLAAAMNAHDIDAFVACFAPDYDSVQPAHPDRAFTGSEQVRKNWSEIFAGCAGFPRRARSRASADWRHAVDRVALDRHRPRHGRRRSSSASATA